MRIVAGVWRGRTLIAPPGQGTRPTADRVRQALFDMLLHADWGGRALIQDAVVLDVFAGTGALGLEALSRGAASACFIENDAAALKALRANVAACEVEARTRILAVDVLSVVGALPIGLEAHKDALCDRLGRGQRRPIHLSRQLAATADRNTLGRDSGRKSNAMVPASIVFLDPPYARDLVPQALARLGDARRIRPNALVVAEIGRDEIWAPEQPLLTEREYGAARILVFRAA